MYDNTSYTQRGAHLSDCSLTQNAPLPDSKHVHRASSYSRMCDVLSQVLTMVTEPGKALAGSWDHRHVLFRECEEIMRK